jgi:glycosyltransferase involved in cell wall biosynthesis
MRLAIAHDYLYVYGGAERALEHVHAIWPEAPIYTLLFVRDRLPGTFRSMDIRSTWVDRLPGRLRLQRLYAMLQPVAFAGVRVRDADALLSFASFGAKAIAAPPGGRHVSYCYTPPRFLWGPHSGISREGLAWPARRASRTLEGVLRRWDLWAARRVDCFITQSRYVRDRIRRVYGREAAVVPPPVDVARFSDVPARDDGYFLIVSRFEAYKRIDLAIRACSRLGLELRIVGRGVDDARLRRVADECGGGAHHIRFTGSLPDRDVVTQLAGCRALLLPGEEDFGLVPLEAQAVGKPVIAYGAGGALETVVPGLTGEFFAELSVDSLTAALAAFRPDRYDPSAARRNAARFAPDRFKARLKAAVEALAVPGQ